MKRLVSYIVRPIVAARLALCLFAFVAPLFLIVQGKAASRVKFSVAQRANPFYDLLITAMEEKGFWKLNGLEVEVFIFRGGGAMYAALAAQALDMGVTGGAGVVQAAARGVPVVIVAEAGKQNFYIWVRTETPIKKPEELKGAKIGINTLGGLVHTYGRVVARALNMEKEIVFVAGGTTPAQHALMRTGKLDGVISGLATLAGLKHRGLVRQVLSIRDFLPKDWIDQAVVAQKNFLAEDRETVRKTIKTLVQAGRFVSDNPDWAVAKLKAALAAPDEAAQEAYQEIKYSPDGKIDPKGVENILHLLQEYGLVPRDKAPPADTLYALGLTG